MSRILIRLRKLTRILSLTINKQTGKKVAKERKRRRSNLLSPMKSSGNLWKLKSKKE
jgi:hypothetical protein